MSEEPHMSFADGVRVKEELEIGPTVLQSRSVCHTTTKVEWDQEFDTSRPTSCSIKTEYVSDADDESEALDTELLTAECAPPEILSVEESLKDDTGSREVEDVKPVVTDMLKWEVEEKQWSPEVQPRVLATEACAGGSLTRVARPGPEERHATAAQGDTHCKPTRSGKRLIRRKISKAKVTQAGHLKRHKRTHTGEKPFKCKICNAKFTRAYQLKSHKRTHTGEKPFKCEIYNAKFTESGHLKRHNRTHTGEKPFECEICNAKFTRAGSLKRHNRTHTGEKPFECEICNAKFTRAGSLKRHNRTHTDEKPFECEICNRKFTRTGNLKSHKRTHTGEKPFECEICNAKFTRTGSLKSHKRTHTGEKPFD